jgi:hypothetical protein
MTKTFHRVSIALSALALSSAAIAQKDFGNTDCGTFIQHRADPMSPDNAADSRWVAGYLSGMNAAWSVRAAESQKDPLRDLQSMEQAISWLENYCRTNGRGTIRSGATDLFYDLVDRRRGARRRY